MESSNTTSARLCHLQKASEVLAVASPVVAAYLHSARQSLADSATDSQTDGKDGSHCSGCGAFLLPGRICESRDKIKASKIKKRTRQDRLASQQPDRALVFQCNRCNYENPIQAGKTIKIGTPVPRNRAQPSSLLAITSTQSDKSQRTRSDDKEPAKMPESRAKRRNGNQKSSLAAMLASKKAADAESKNGFGLDLMDFMKR